MVPKLSITRILVLNIILNGENSHNNFTIQWHGLGGRNVMNKIVIYDKNRRFSQ